MCISIVPYSYIGTVLIVPLCMGILMVVYGTAGTVILVAVLYQRRLKRQEGADHEEASRDPSLIYDSVYYTVPVKALKEIKLDTQCQQNNFTIQQNSLALTVWRNWEDVPLRLAEYKRANIE